MQGKNYIKKLYEPNNKLIKSFMLDEQYINDKLKIN